MQVKKCLHDLEKRDIRESLDEQTYQAEFNGIHSNSIIEVMEENRDPPIAVEK